MTVACTIANESGVQPCVELSVILAGGCHTSILKGRLSR